MVWFRGSKVKCIRARMVKFWDGGARMGDARWDPWFWTGTGSGVGWSGLGLGCPSPFLTRKDGGGLVGLGAWMQIITVVVCSDSTCCSKLSRVPWWKRRPAKGGQLSVAWMATMGHGLVSHIRPLFSPTRQAHARSLARWFDRTPTPLPPSTTPSMGMLLAVQNCPSDAHPVQLQLLHVLRDRRA
ncbi:uncharacterized protein J3D65DRAFT_258852 [Phyllosticta citribraziliensis]|uniref:Uncharacterized protein n=1 Tax=Phyllosticta citribraziliensis TaxID=989973 RepID=A0ABR1M1P5_9PEZI